MCAMGAGRGIGAFGAVTGSSKMLASVDSGCWIGGRHDGVVVLCPNQTEL